MKQPEIITIKLGSGHDVQGEWVWGPNGDGIACVRLEDGTTRQGQHVPHIPGLMDCKKEGKVYE